MAKIKPEDKTPDKEDVDKEAKKNADLSTKGHATPDIDPDLNKNNDPSNQSKMEANKKEGDSIVDPTNVYKPHLAHQGVKKDTPKNKVTIAAISGKKVTLDTSDDNDPLTVYIASNAEVYLNGEKVTLAALDNGDEVVVSIGKMNDRTSVFEYNRIDAIRDC